MLLDENLIPAEFIESLMLNNQAEIKIAEEISKYLEKHTMEDLEDAPGHTEGRIIKLLSLEGNPTLGEIRSIASAIGKKLIIDFSN